MKKTYGFFTILSTMMILLITTSAGASFTNDGKGVYGRDRQPGGHLGIRADDPLVKASTNLSDRQKTPEGLTKTEWKKISASIERDRYRVHKGHRTGAYQAANHTHGLDAAFTREGFAVSPREGDKGWNWGLSLSRYGYGSDLHAVPVVKKMITKDNRIEYLRGDMVEWYINDHRGLEQGFTLKARPSGRTDSGLLQLQMTTTTNLIPVVEKEGKGIIFRDARGKEVLRYSGLYAYDASGKDLGARMAVDNKIIRLIVADHEAVYPITIDPFIETKKLLASDGAADDEFGVSVAISGNTVVVGAQMDDISSVNNQGSAYVFEKSGSAWTQTAKLTASDGAMTDLFGSSVDVSGDTVVVGAIYDDVIIPSDQGSAYVFVRPVSGWTDMTQTAKLTADDGENGDFLGRSVAISGDTVVVGADDDDIGSNTDQGSAYVFVKPVSGWADMTQTAKLIASDGAVEDYFGQSVGISGDTVVVGAYKDDVSTYNDQGSTYVFVKPVTGWVDMTQTAKLTTYSGEANTFFGYSVAISSDTVLAGASLDDNINGINAGAAYVFVKPQTGWVDTTETAKLTADNGEAFDAFGWSVSISGNMAVVGADEGLAYVFIEPMGGWADMTETEELIAEGVVSDDRFGLSVAISGDMVVIGAQGDDDNGSNSGSAYIFSSLFGDELAMDFGGLGLWDYDGTTWRQLSSSSPECMTGWSGGLAMDFSHLGFGLWNYDGTTWAQISGSDVEDMVDWTNGLAMDFGGLGLWNYDGSTWTQISGSSPECMSGWANGLAMDFGGLGLWNYDGSTWMQLSASSPEDMTGWSDGLAMDFGGLGLWNYDGSTWTQISGSSPECMSGWANGLAMDFGGLGLWSFDGSTWIQLSSSDVEGMTGWSDGLAMDFGGLGLWNYDGSTWTQISGSDVEDMADVDLY